MHKNIPVVDIEIDEPTALILKIGNVHNPKHIPLGTDSMKGGVDKEELNDWLRSRSIPASRSGIWNLYKSLNKMSTEHLIIPCLALSLSDHYWVRPKGSALSWGDVNFFQNSFSTDMGEILFGQKKFDNNPIDLMSPDNTSAGWLQKKWIISGGKRVLVKGGSDPWQQEPYNEVVASIIEEKLKITHVTYSILDNQEAVFSVCENFLSESTELIPAWMVFHSNPIIGDETDFSHLLRCCDSLSIPNVRQALNRMLVLDYIIANEDRHYMNFGFVRCADTLEWIGMEPLFDNGTSLWYNVLDIGSQRKCKPFLDNHEEQLTLVSDFSWFDPASLIRIEDEIEEIYSKSRKIDATRAKAIAMSVRERIDRIALKTEFKKREGHCPSRLLLMSFFDWVLLALVILPHSPNASYKAHGRITTEDRSNSHGKGKRLNAFQTVDECENKHDHNREEENKTRVERPNQHFRGALVDERHRSERRIVEGIFSHSVI
jgi:hypothetical protein